MAPNEAEPTAEDNNNDDLDGTLSNQQPQEKQPETSSWSSFSKVTSSLKDKVANKAGEVAGDVGSKSEEVAGDFDSKAREVAGDLGNKAGEVAGEAK